MTVFITSPLGGMSVGAETPIVPSAAGAFPLASMVPSDCAGVEGVLESSVDPGDPTGSGPPGFEPGALGAAWREADEACLGGRVGCTHDRLRSLAAGPEVNGDQLHSLKNACGESDITCSPLGLVCVTPIAVAGIHCDQEEVKTSLFTPFWFFWKKAKLQVAVLKFCTVGGELGGAGFTTLAPVSALSKGVAKFPGDVSWSGSVCAGAQEDAQAGRCEAGAQVDRSGGCTWDGGTAQGCTSIELVGVKTYKCWLFLGCTGLHALGQATTTASARVFAPVGSFELDGIKDVKAWDSETQSI